MTKFESSVFFMVTQWIIFIVLKFGSADVDTREVVYIVTLTS